MSPRTRSSYDVEAVLKRLGAEYERRGRRFWLRCPRAASKLHHAHGDAEWSCSIWPNEAGDRSGLWICHACKLGGNLAQLVVFVLGLRDDFVTTAWQKADEWLAGSITHEKPIVSVTVTVAPLRSKPFELPSGIVVDVPVEQWPDRMRDYVLVERRLTPEQIRRWGIGYAVDGRLAGRVVVVTRDRSGRPVNYSARAVAATTKRYLMADSAEGANRQILFGEQHWQDGGTVILTEGAFDALAVERVRPGCSVGALSGSHVTPATVARLSVFGRIVIATDADSAGRRAADKLTAAFVRSKVLDYVTYPAGQDANSLPPEDLSALLPAV